MKRTLISIIIFTIFLLASLFSVEGMKSQNINVNAIQTWTVDNEGDGDFKQIQQAINKANPGDIIEVYSGIYKEHIKINKQIILKGISTELGAGEDSGKPIIDGNHFGDVMEINADGCAVSNFRIQNSGRTYSMKKGIKITSNNCRIINNTLQNNFVGIGLSNTKNCVVAENILFYNIFGIYATKPNNCTISNNSLFNTGLIFSATADQLLTNTIKNNKVNNKTFYLYINKNDTTISNADAGQVEVINCNNVTIENLNIHDTSIGLITSYCSNLKIKNNTFENIHRGGISLHGNNCEVFNNTFRNCSYGCYLEGGENFYIHHNNFIKVFKHDQPCISWIKKHQTFMESKNIIFDKNYWDDWIGLKIPSMRWMPKIIPGFRTYTHKWLNIFPIFEFDMHPALEPY
ncbi:MAG: hypothetical protein DRM98_00840 [Thermoplasmata archaeon]|nr:MAG: hypothetical protein FE039_02255 [Thermoplasmata archaeon]RLF34335.1 MAG: hypothetical protein DRM98_00840 [Thermoplasmata archaeon]RLF36911.1 MAG: hypothetical protein DRM99_01735 [Thermoplasmata archaeon]RLF53373.1 MAG: hypothetical protein DRN24_01140 [Thermoplasmata archaeon]